MSPQDLRAPGAGLQLPLRPPARQRLRHLPVAVVLLLGAALRVVVTMTYQPALRFPDSSTYLAGAVNLRPSPLRPLGYSIFLWLLRPLGTLAWVPVLQHLLALALVVALYVFLVQQGLRPWLATIAAAPLALDAYEAQIEQYVLAETLFLALLMMALGMLLHRGRPGYARLAACGLLLAGAALTRSTALPLIAVPVAFVLLQRIGWRRLAVVVAAFLVLPAGYTVLYHHAYGTYALGGNTGRFLYGRVAPFADCARLPNVPANQRRLCESTPPAQRTTGSEWYDWNRRSPAAAFRGPQADAVLQSFAVRVIRAQPGDYAYEIGHDTLHYFLPGRSASPQDSCQDFWTFRSDDPTKSMQLCSTGAAKVGWLGVITFGYDHRPVPHHTNARLAHVLQAYQAVAYTPGPLLALCLLLCVVAAARRRRLSHESRQRATAALALGAIAALLVIVPSATAVFDYRYGLQLLVVLPAAGALALSALAPEFCCTAGRSTRDGGRTGSD